MTDERASRKMSAILSADVKGYSNLMSKDEEGTVKALNDCREIIAKHVLEHRGRVVDSPGDNVLAEFVSTVEAVKCAVKIQEDLKVRNADIPESSRMEFRIGVNLGDVIEEKDRIYGDGVNIAARIEGLAEAGGICISGTAFDQVKGKLSLGYQFVGRQTVKNITDPIRAYKVLMEPEHAGKVIGDEKHNKWRWAQIAAVVLIVTTGTLGVWHYFFRLPSIEPASREAMAYPLPDKPSIAVLPFANMSEDPKQEFLSDGISANIITALSKTPGLFVIARNSTFVYKGKPVKVKQVSEELGVRYVLEGSLQRSADRLRVNTQLIDAVKGHHIWAERYDRNIKDLFAVEDEITLRIAEAMRVQLSDWVRGRVFAGKTKNLSAYLKIMEAHELMLRFTQNDNKIARKIGEEAIALDPQYAEAYGVLSTIYLMDMFYGVSPKESKKKSFEAAQKSLSLDETSINGRINLAFLYTVQQEHDKALATARKGMELNPGSAFSFFALGRALNFACKHQEAVEMLEKAIRMNPFPRSAFYHHLGYAYFNLERYEDAVATLRKAVKLSPNGRPGRYGLIASLAQAGLLEEAKSNFKDFLKVRPQASVKDSQRGGIGKWADKRVTQRWADAFRKIGVPEEPQPLSSSGKG
jgi:adenylate cyclase